MSETKDESVKDEKTVVTDETVVIDEQETQVENDKKT